MLTSHDSVYFVSEGVFASTDGKTNRSNILHSGRITGAEENRKFDSLLGVRGTVYTSAVSV